MTASSSSSSASSNCSTSTVFTCPSSYKCSDRGLILPMVNESDWSTGVRVLLYCIAMVYCFMGIAIVADIFMSSIEKITSTSRKIKVATLSSKRREDDKSVSEGSAVEAEVKEVEVRIWNDTVANLTLMALGSSAPEILLAIIETVGNGFKSGEMGPATIVGSAAFNLHVITGVCISSLPKDDVRTIKEGSVFICTAVVSLLAYFWLYLILGPISPNVVDVWEALLTLLYFPLLVIVAYLIDKKFLCGGKKNSKIGVASETASISDADGVYMSMPGDKELGGPTRVDKAKVAEIVRNIAVEKDINVEEAAAVVAQKVHSERPHSRAYHRASRGSKSATSFLSKASVTSLSREVTGDQHGSDEVKLIGDRSLEDDKCVVQFGADTVSVYEGDRVARLRVKRTGSLANKISVKYETYNGTAEAGTDYMPRKDLLVFQTNEDCKIIEIDIIDDQIAEDDETFFVRLSLDEGVERSGKTEDCSSPQAVPIDDHQEHQRSVATDTDKTIVQIGKKSVCTVFIMNDDQPGVFEFEKPSVLIRESVGVAKIPVIRHSGTDGTCSVSWRAIVVSESVGNCSPEEWVWGTPSEGRVNFQHGEANGSIELNIVDQCKERLAKTGQFQKCKNNDRNVQLILMQPTNGSTVGKRKATVITIVCDDEFSTLLDRVTKLANIDLEKLNFTLRSWGEQIHESMNVNGGDSDEAAWDDYVMHAVTFFWKVLFAVLIPPPKYAGGWLTFVISLVMVGLLTAIVGDLAAIFGCLLGMKDLVTAITFVALGTSLPDLFASKQAAISDKHADNAVGNVTGSNSVNVFLGLGLPWTVASLYWASKGEPFVVPAGSFSYSVVLYTGTAVIALALLALRRFLSFFGNAELGGPTIPKYASSVILYILWFTYILLSALESYNRIESF